LFNEDVSLVATSATSWPRTVIFPWKNSQDVDPEVVAKALRFMYTGTICVEKWEFFEVSIGAWDF